MIDIVKSDKIIKILQDMKKTDKKKLDNKIK
jgi:hypothetical protein